MKKKVGIWVDTEKAVFISIDQKKRPIAVHQIVQGKRKSKLPKELNELQAVLSSSIQTKLRIPGDSKEFSRSGNQHYSTELKNSHKFQNEKKHYFRNILEGIKDADEVVIFGPSNIKKELENQIEKNPRLQTHLAGVQSADAMSDRQMVRWVENYFSSNAKSKIMQQ
jgi:hypothetical protein